MYCIEKIKMSIEFFRCDCEKPYAFHFKENKRQLKKNLSSWNHIRQLLCYRFKFCVYKKNYEPVKIKEEWIMKIELSGQFLEVQFQTTLLCSVLKDSFLTREYYRT